MRLRRGARGPEAPSASPQVPTKPRFASLGLGFQREGDGESGKKVLARNRAGENQEFSSGKGKRRAVARARQRAEEKTSKIRREGGGEGGGREGEDRAAPGSPVRHLGGPGPNAGRAKRAPGRLAARAGSQLHLGSRRGLKTPSGGGLQSGSKALRSSEGGRASAQELFTRRVGTRGEKTNQNKPLSSSVGRENKSCLIKGASGSFEI